MQLLSRIGQRIKRDYFRWQHHRNAQAVLATAPLGAGKLSFTLLSMVQHRDVLSYLVAVKSFYQFLPAQRVVVVCDPTIDEGDRALIRKHVPQVQFHAAASFAHPEIPRGGCWERLSAIAEFVRDGYVVQLDADTVTVQPMAEVEQAILTGCGFVLGEQPDTPIRSLDATRQNALPWIEPGCHIQATAETEMVNVGLPADACYIRGCAGFTGFPRSSDMRAAMLDYAVRMGGRIGPDWQRWGTEQVASNYLVSNAQGTRPLPFPKYGTPDCATQATAFYHFIGSMRFINGKYARVSRQAIDLFD